MLCVYCLISSAIVNTEGLGICVQLLLNWWRKLMPEIESRFSVTDRSQVDKSFTLFQVVAHSTGWWFHCGIIMHQIILNKVLSKTYLIYDEIDVLIIKISINWHKVYVCGQVLICYQLTHYSKYSDLEILMSHWFIQSVKEYLISALYLIWQNVVCECDVCFIWCDQVIMIPLKAHIMTQKVNFLRRNDLKLSIFKIDFLSNAIWNWQQNNQVKTLE